jgi:hypothetical protein
MAAAFTTSDGITHSAVVNGLANGGVYNYYVRCQDASGNGNPDDLLIAFAVASSSTTTPFYQYIEAESGAVVAPMAVAADALASGGKYVSTPTDGAGSLTFNLTVPATGSYYVWGKVLSLDAASDSFYVSVDGACTIPRSSSGPPHGNGPR